MTGNVQTSASEAYPLLFEPLRIGPVTAANRIVFAAHFTLFSEPNPVWGEPGWLGARQGRYSAERAAGGAGTIIVGQVHVHPAAAYAMRNNAAGWQTESVAHFRDVVEPIRAHGALAFVQLAHGGAKSSSDWSAYPLYAPSAVPVYAESPKVLEVDEIADIVEHFAISAGNAAAAGFDGIEIHGAHHYLIHQFMSPAYNRREDDYGGSFESRMRFPVEVLRAVRAAAPGLAVGIRLPGDDQTGDQPGIGPADAARIAVHLEQLGLVDFLDVSVGRAGAMVQPMYRSRGFGVAAAGVVKRAVHSTPVFAVHRIVTPDEAEAVLHAGEADAVSLVRALIADPDWAVKARAGRADEIRPCTGCNQLCSGNLYRSLPVQCATNPAVGREQEMGAGTLRRAEVSRSVVVVGGGPGGLEAAWVAAARGHRVVLLERGNKLGGKVRLAERLPGRSEMSAFASWRIAECHRQGVEVRLGVDANADGLLAWAPDVVIVATGCKATSAVPIIGTTEGHSSMPTVLDHEGALVNPASVGARVLIVDLVGHVEGAGLAQLLAETGRRVTLTSPLASLTQLDALTAAAALQGACGAGAIWRPSTGIVTCTPAGAILRSVFGGCDEPIDVDTIVVRAHGRADDHLYHALVARGAEVLRVGDAVAARSVDRAIFEGNLAGRTV